MGKAKLVGRRELEMSQILCKAKLREGAGQWEGGTANGGKKSWIYFYFFQ